MLFFAFIFLPAQEYDTFQCDQLRAPLKANFLSAKNHYAQSFISNYSLRFRFRQRLTHRLRYRLQRLNTLCKLARAIATAAKLHGTRALLRI
jgi:hypothetical protein